MGAIRHCDIVLVTDNANNRLSNAPDGCLRIGKNSNNGLCQETHYATYLVVNVFI